MSAISAFVPPPAGSAAARALAMWAKHMENDAEFTEFFERALQRAAELVDTQQENGAGLEPDKTLREFAIAYSGRAAQHGLLSLPSSFNVMEAFLEFVPPLSVFAVRPEADHLFDLTGFLDFVTSRSAEDELMESLELLTEGVVHSYQNIAPLGAFTVATKEGKEFGIGGASLIRHGNEISVLLIAGEVADTVAATEKLYSSQTHATIAGKEAIQPDPTLKPEAVPLMDDPQMWRVLALARLDVATRTEEVRYLLWDHGNSYRTLTDDAAIFFGPDGRGLVDDAEQVAARIVAEIVPFQPLFEVIKSALWLPIYFEEYEEDVEEERHRTAYGERSRPERRRLRNEWPSEERISERRVRLLDRALTSEAPGQMRFMAPEFRVETSGYWKRIPVGNVGADRRGRQVHGKTWVEKRLVWKEASAIAIHRSPVVATAANIVRSAGSIYIMRSAMHPRDVFKVGHTTRTPDERAVEVSRGSGVPDGLFPMYEWRVRDSQLVERLVHDALSQYRLSDSREFFHVSLLELVKTIERVIADSGMAVASDDDGSAV